MRQNSAQNFGKKSPTYQKIVTILPSIIDNSTIRRSFYANLYGQIASRIIQNLQRKFFSTGLTPPHPFWTMFKKQTIWSGRAPLSKFNFWTSHQVPVAIYGLDPDTKERVRLYRIFVSLIVAQNPYLSTFIQVPYTDCADVPLEVTLSNSKDFSYVSKSGGRISRESMQTKQPKSGKLFFSPVFLFPC